MENTPPTNELIEQLTRSLSPEGREVLDLVEALEPVTEADSSNPEPAAALIESLPNADRTTIYRIMGLTARAHQSQAEEYAEEARFASQAVAVIDHARDLERAAGREPDEDMTLGEALEVLKAHGKERTVLAWYPDFTNADQWRRWDGSEQAEAWARLVDSREAAILASVGDLAGADVEGIDYAGLIAALWNLDEDEAAEFVQRRQSGRP
jgi:hypothetical protein